MKTSTMSSSAITTTVMIARSHSCLDALTIHAMRAGHDSGSGTERRGRWLGTGTHSTLG